MNLFFHPRSRCTARTNDSKSTGFGNSGGKLGFTSGGANYYLGRYGYSSLSISTSGSRASYSSSRLSLGGYYLRYSNGYFSLNWRSASTCYMFEQTN